MSEKRRSFLRLLKKKGFKEKRTTKVGLYAIGTSTTLESNKSLRQNPLNCNPSPTPPASYYTCLTPTDITNIKAWIKNGAN